MSIIETIRNKPTHQKMKIIWGVVIVAALLLVAAWISTSRMRKNLPKDTSIFKTISNGIRNISEQYHNK